MTIRKSIHYRLIGCLVLFLLSIFSHDGTLVAQNGQLQPIYSGSYPANGSWSSDSQRFVFTDTLSFETGIELSEPLWFQYDTMTDTVTSQEVWPLQPSFSESELPLFNPATSADGRQTFVFESPNHRFLVYAGQQDESLWQLRLADRQVGETVNLPNFTPDPFSGLNFFQVSWSADGTAFTTFTLTDTFEPFVQYASNFELNLANTTAVDATFEVGERVFRGLDSLAVGVSGDQVVLVALEDNPEIVNPDNLARKIVIWDTLAPETSHIIEELDGTRVIGASFMPDDESTLLILNDQGLIQYDLETRQISVIDPALTGAEAQFSPNHEYLALLDGSGLVFVIKVADLVPTIPPSATETPTATLSSTSTETPTATNTPTPTSPLSSFAVLGQEGIWLEQDSVLVSGDVGANVASSGPFLAQGSEVTIGIGVDFLSPSSRVLGDSVYVRQGAAVYDVYYNELDGQGQILGQQFTPLALPVVQAFPTVPSFSPGTQNFDLPQNGNLTLDAGDYGTLETSQGSTITFTGGVYNFQEWDLGLSVNVFFAAPTEVRVAGRLQVGQGSYVGPATGSNLNATNIIIYVTGQNGNTGNLGGTPKAAHFGINNTLSANVYAPNGTLWIRQGSTARGAFLGKWVDIGVGVEITLESAF